MKRYIQGFILAMGVTSLVLAVVNHHAVSDEGEEEYDLSTIPFPEREPLPYEVYAEPTPRPRLPPAIYNLLLLEPTPAPTPTPLNIRTIMAFGDSITYGSETSSHGPLTAYPNYLDRELGYRYRMVNAGKGGETTYKGVRRIAGAIKSCRADMVLIMEGINDLWWAGYSYDLIELNLRIMVGHVLGQGLIPIIATLTPARDNSLNYRIQAFNYRIYRIASSFNINVAEVSNFILADPNWKWRLYKTPDGVHPNDLGERIIAEAFEVEVREALQ